MTKNVYLCKMEITVKYKKDDIVHFLKDNKIEQAIIYSGYSLFNNNNNFRNYYWVKQGNEMMEHAMKEEILFESTEKLKESL